MPSLRSNSRNYLKLLLSISLPFC
uniref:Uncharacterized protein n=1 Tax=Rhizophora mucronata TaxID=61149 RepID=A0A2P2P7A6_RHIMU